jgi:hypothetical protein
MQEERKTQILSEEIIYEWGSFKRVRRYLKGWHPERGKLSFGWQGKETIEEKDVIIPIKTFMVENEQREPVDTKR